MKIGRKATRTRALKAHTPTRPPGVDAPGGSVEAVGRGQPPSRGRRAAKIVRQARGEAAAEIHFFTFNPPWSDANPKDAESIACVSPRKAEMTGTRLSSRENFLTACLAIRRCVLTVRPASRDDDVSIYSGTPG